MKLEKSKNAGKNMAFELFQNIYRVIIPFIQRTLMIAYLGIEYAGLGGLFTSILQVLSLAELGVGTAMIYSMYKPIAEDDESTIVKLLNLYKKYYRIIGLTIFSIGLIITPFLKFFIKDGTYPKDINIYVLFMMTLLSTVLTYWLYAYKSSILQAYQKTYVITRVEMEVTFILDILQILFIVIFQNYYLYLSCAIVRVIIKNLVLAYRTNKLYPQYKTPKGTLEKKEEKKIRRSIKDIFLNKIGDVLTNSFDSIVISTFLGLTILGRYQNYFFIWTSVLAIAGIVFNATRAGIGNSIITESKEKVYNDLKTFTFIVTWIIALLIAGFSNLFQPFIKLWVGEDNVLDYGIVVCFCLFTLLRLYCYLLDTYKSASGIWHADRFRPLISGVVNLIFNLITVQFWGLYGVILSTVVSIFIVDIPWLIHNVFKNIFKDKKIRNYLIYFLRMLVYISISVGCSCIVCKLIHFTGMLEIVVKTLLSLTVCNIILIFLSFRTREFSRSREIIKKIIKK